MTAPIFDRDGVTVYNSDALQVLRELPAASVDALITDPPYSSGGLFRGDRTADPNEKYMQSGQDFSRVTFTGDNRDQRSWAFWSILWLTECLRIVKPRGYVLLFTDWRQLPTTTDILQAGGFVWRGIIPWDKGRGARPPSPAYFRNQAEYIVWGSSGPLPDAADGRGPWDGVVHVASGPATIRKALKFPVLQSDKFHPTGKPTALLRELVKVCPPGGVILDPFAGSGTTAVAAAMMGRRCICIEQTPFYAGETIRRVTELQRQPALAASEPEQQAELF